jgi:hypothetical protein
MSTLKIIQGFQNDVPTISILPPMQQIAHNSGLPIHLFKATDNSGLECFCFESSLADYSKCIMAQMYVPAYFDGMTKQVRGYFLLRIAHNNPEFIDDFFGDKKYGREGCGYNFVTSSKGMFKFNGFTYHPFILRNLTVCYFACETDSDEDEAWRDSLNVGVAIQSPLHYDHRLDLFITTHAELKPS